MERCAEQCSEELMLPSNASLPTMSLSPPSRSSSSRSPSCGMTSFLSSFPFYYKAESNLFLYSGLRHPNIVLFMGSCYDSSSGEMLLVMELMSRGSLNDVLNNPKVIFLLFFFLFLLLFISIYLVLYWVCIYLNNIDPSWL